MKKLLFITISILLINTPLQAQARHSRSFEEIEKEFPPDQFNGKIVNFEGGFNYTIKSEKVLVYYSFDKKIRYALWFLYSL